MFYKNFVNIMATFLALLATQLGCSSFFLQPTKIDYTAEWKERSNYLKENSFFKSVSGNGLNYWVFPPQKSQKPKAIVMQFHGNAQNISSHFASLGWLADFDYEFMTFDYSGYGKSQGKAKLSDVLKDVDSALKFAQQRANKHGVPLFLYGQSLGGALLLQGLKNSTQDLNVCSVFVESSFYSYPKIAQSIAQRFWLLWPLQWIPLLSISNRNDPVNKRNLHKLGNYNKIFLHSKNDLVIPFSHGTKLYDKVPEPKKFWTYIGGHISFWGTHKNQKKLVGYLNKNTNLCAHKKSPR